MSNYRPKFIVLVVYKSKDASWRGFCFPYDVSCNAESKVGAMKKLEKLVKLYEEGLENYNYPKHLSIRELTDEEDKSIFEKIERKVIEHYAQHIRERMRKNILEFQREKFWQEVSNTIKNSSVSSVRIYTPTLSVPIS